MQSAWQSVSRSTRYESAHLSEGFATAPKLLVLTSEPRFPTKRFSRRFPIGNYPIVGCLGRWARGRRCETSEPGSVFLRPSRTRLLPFVHVLVFLPDPKRDQTEWSVCATRLLLHACKDRYRRPLTPAEYEEGKSYGRLLPRPKVLIIFSRGPLVEALRLILIPAASSLLVQGRVRCTFSDAQGPGGNLRPIARASG